MSMKHSLTFNFECSDIYTPTQIVVITNSMCMVKIFIYKVKQQTGNNKVVIL